MVILGTKKAITKKETKELYYDLNQAFDLIGEKVNGESWEQLKKCHTSCNLINVLSGLIKYDFFDLFNQDDAINKLNDRQKNVLLSDAVNFQSFAKKIATRDKDVVIAGNSISSPSIKLTDSIKKSFYEKYNPDPQIKYKPTKTKKGEDCITLPSVIDNEPDKINYTFSTNFLIPKEQFNYVLETGRRWSEKEPNKNYQGMIISKHYINFRLVKSDSLSMMFVGEKSNLINYFDLKKFLKKKFKASDYDIQEWLMDDDLLALEDDVGQDGYVKFISNVAAGSTKNYVGAFYYKVQVENFNPQNFYIEYNNLIDEWRRRFAIGEIEAQELLLKYLSIRDVILLFNQSFSKLTSRPPINKDSIKRLDTFSDNIKNLSKAEQISFIKECYFEKSYITKIEEKHLNSSLHNQQEQPQNTFEDQDVKKICEFYINNAECTGEEILSLLMGRHPEEKINPLDSVFDDTNRDIKGNKVLFDFKDNDGRYHCKRSEFFRKKERHKILVNSGNYRLLEDFLSNALGSNETGKYNPKDIINCFKNQARFAIPEILDELVFGEQFEDNKKELSKRGTRDNFDNKDKPVWKHLITKVLEVNFLDEVFTEDCSVLDKRQRYAKQFKDKLKQLPKDRRSKINNQKIKSVLDSYKRKESIKFKEYDHFITLINKAN